jgi:hypothetical protein
VLADGFDGSRPCLLTIQPPIGGGEVDQPLLAPRQRAGLVKHDHVQFARRLQGHAVANQDAIARRQCRRDGDHQWDGQTERVRTGAHQRGDGALERVVVEAAGECPADERNRGTPTAISVSQKAVRSASACARVRLDCASCTSRMMPASTVSSPVLLICTRRLPLPLTVPSMTAVLCAPDGIRR